MRLLARLDQGSGKPKRGLLRISPQSSPSSSLASCSSSSPSSPSLSQSSADSPTSPPSSPPSPISYFDPFETPQSPLPWTWICHVCQRSWRIGTTSRCLNCSHRMCMAGEPTAPSKRNNFHLTRLNLPQPLSSLLSAEKPLTIRLPMLPLKRDADLVRHRYIQQIKRHFRKSRIRQHRKRKIKYCRTQFDFNGWEDWNEWRRDVKRFKVLSRMHNKDKSESGDDTDDSEKTLVPDSDEDKDTDDDTKDSFKLVPATGRLHVVASSSPGSSLQKESPKSLEWNCWDDCDFPAHCFHQHKNEVKIPETPLQRKFR